MIRPRYQSRLSSLILGVRPSITHINGVRLVTSPDNFSLTGTTAWRTGLQMLIADLGQEPDPLGGEVWLYDWASRELEREAVRWTDASSMLEQLLVSIGPTAPEHDILRSQIFWAQWSRNISATVLAINSGTGQLSEDTHELAQESLFIVRAHGGPTTLTSALAEIVARGPGAPLDTPVFRPLCAPTERVQLTALVESSMTGDTICTATEAILLDQRELAANPGQARWCRHHSRGGRTRPHPHNRLASPPEG